MSNMLGKIGHRLGNILLVIFFTFQIKNVSMPAKMIIHYDDFKEFIRINLSHIC